MSKEYTIEMHRKMWNIIAEITEEEWKALCDCYPFSYRSIKRYAIKKIGDGKVRNNCYCCEYVFLRKYSDIVNCYYYCPVKWYFNYCSNSEYRDWIEAVESENYELAKKIALVIANLPENEVEE